MALFRPRKRSAASVLDRPLLHLSPHDVWTIRDACEGTHVFGATGSGKTSGSGQAIAKAFLRNGFGGLVCTAKPDERALWQRYTRETGRENDLIIFSPSEKWRFNFLDYELKRPGEGAGLTENLVQLFCNVLEVSDRKSGGGKDDYWQKALKQLLRNAFDLILIARGTISLPDIHKIITSAPQSPDDLYDDSWTSKSECFACIEQADKKPKTPSQEQDFDLTAAYWLKEFPALASRTRSIIVSSFTGMADCFLRGALRDLFCTTTNLTPEMTHEGKIILLDLPVKQYDDLGIYAQILFKMMWQRSVERRDIKTSPNPVFLWADEAQNFLTSNDLLFQTTARSARACTVYLTQNLANYYAVLSGPTGKAATDSLLGNLNTQIFHANGSHETNTWAADLFAKTWQIRVGSSQSTRSSPDQDSDQSGSSTSQALDHHVLPIEFTALRKGGPENDLLVDAILFQGGRIWNASGSNALKLSFPQNPKEN